MTVLEAVDLAKVVSRRRRRTITVLDGVNLEVERGEMVAIIGSSGAGKSTLLHVLGALDKPTRGARADRRAGPLTGRTDDALSALRNRTVGFVFQFHHLLREFTALENVMMPLRIAGGTRQGARRARGVARAAWDWAARMQHRPAAALGRRAAAHGGGARARDRSGRRCSPTSRRGISIMRTASDCTICSRSWPAISRSRWSSRRTIARSPRAPTVATARGRSSEPIPTFARSWPDVV